MCSALAVLGCFAVAPSAHGGGPVIGGFTVSRGGGFAILGGSELDELRTSISGAFPGTTYTSASVLTPQYLGTIDILFISATWDGNTAIAPLTPTEVAAVRAFINHGGSAILVTDNSTFGGAGSEPANESIVDAVGIDVGGTGAPWPQGATVQNPASSPVTNGPFGLVAGWNVGWSGWFDAVPGNGTVLGTINESGLPGLVYFPRHALAGCSGAVVALTDATQFADGYFTIGNALDKIVRNTIAVFTAPACPNAVCGDINGDGTVDGADLGSLLGQWATNDVATDLDANGIVDGADLGILLGNWGTCD